VKVHWRVHLELADLAKRENHPSEARRLYRLAVRMQPYAAQVWGIMRGWRKRLGSWRGVERFFTLRCGIVLGMSRC